MSARANDSQANEKAAPFAAGRPDIKPLEGNQMHYNLTADDYDVEIGELIDQYKPQSGSRHFGLLAIYRSSYNRINGRWEASIHVDERFTGNQVSSYVDSDDETNHVIRVDGYDLCEVLRNVRNAFVASTPVAVAIAKGA